MFCRFCLCHKAAKIVGEPLCVFTKFLVPKMFMDKRGEEEEGSIAIFCRKFYASVLNNIVEKSFPFFYRFRKIPVAKNFWIRGGGGGGGDYHDFPSKVFCLTVPKKSVGEPFSLSLNSGIEKIWMRGWGGGGCPDFPSKFSCLTVPKGFVGQPSSVSLIPGIEKFYASEVYVTIFCRICWCNSAAKIVGEPFCVFTKFLVSKKFMDKRGGGRRRKGVSQFSAENFSSQC